MSRKVVGDKMRHVYVLRNILKGAVSKTNTKKKKRNEQLQHFSNTKAPLKLNSRKSDEIAQPQHIEQLRVIKYSAP